VFFETGAPVGGQPAAFTQVVIPEQNSIFTASPSDVRDQATGILSPAQQNASSKMFVEGHWLGMETLDLTPSLRQIYRIPSDLQGVIVDEVTLESAESGILAGDVITEIQGQRTGTLAEFLSATMRVCESERAQLVVYRMGQTESITLVAKNTPILGFAAVEAAQPIKPGALSPHKNRNKPCTTCHVIMSTGGQLPVDAGDIVPIPPPIVANAQAPHAYRGVCNSCHQIMKSTGNQRAANTNNVPGIAPAISRNAVAPHGDRGLCVSCHQVQ